MMKKIPIEKLSQDLRHKLKLKLIAGEKGIKKKNVSIAEINRPGMALTGFIDYFPGRRVQVMGLTEFSYLRGIPVGKREKILKSFMAFPIPLIIISRRLRPFPCLIKLANENHIPLYTTSLYTTTVISELHNYLDDRLAPETSIHGTLLDIYGVGVQVMGKSGVGKSECALDLINEGHRLVADDVVTVRKVKNDMLLGFPSPVIGHHMEIRGLGVVDIEKVFGYRAVREEKHIELVVKLEQWVDGMEYERLGLEERYYQILGISLPMVTLPLRSGRNLTVIIEVAATNYRLSQMGINSAQEFNRKVLRYMRERG